MTSDIRVDRRNVIGPGLQGTRIATHYPSPFSLFTSRCVTTKRKAVDVLHAWWHELAISQTLSKVQCRRGSKGMITDGPRRFTEHLDPEVS